MFEQFNSSSYLWKREIKQWQNTFNVKSNTGWPMTTLDIRITRILYVHITSGFDLAVMLWEWSGYPSAQHRQQTSFLCYDEHRWAIVSQEPARSTVLFSEALCILGSNTCVTKFAVLQHKWLCHFVTAVANVKNKKNNGYIIYTSSINQCYLTANLHFNFTNIVSLIRIYCRLVNIVQLPVKDLCSINSCYLSLKIKCQYLWLKWIANPMSPQLFSNNYIFWIGGAWCLFTRGNETAVLPEWSKILRWENEQIQWMHTSLILFNT